LPRARQTGQDFLLKGEIENNPTARMPLRETFNWLKTLRAGLQTLSILDFRFWILDYSLKRTI
jgi:hypothetical protein